MAKDGTERGRPSKYNPETHLVIVQALAKRGLTIVQLAETLDVSPSTVNKWMVEYPDFSEAIKEARDISDESVEASLFQRATGYSVKATKVFLPAGSTEPVYAPYIEHFPPDPTSMIFWLKNRRPEQWRDKQEIEHSGKLDMTSLSQEEFDRRAKEILSAYAESSR